MKKAKRLFATLLAVMLLVMAMAPAMAADDYTVTVEGTATGHTYEAYQIFAGDLEIDLNK